MSNANLLPSNRVALLDAIDPDANLAGTYVTSWISAKDFANFKAIILTGVIGTNGTLDVRLRQATDSSGTGAKDITNKAITQLTQTGDNDSDKQAIINCRSDELDIANGFDYIQLTMDVGTETSDTCALLLGFDARYGIASDYNASSVAEIVA
ncbi:MAG: hypothetical protein AAF228_04810 [Pseudomonadota bacterium]